MNLSNAISIKDHKYFDNFFRQNYQILCHFAFSFIKDKNTSEDIVQNIFVRLLNDSPAYSNEEHLKHYLYKSIRNECINELIKNNVHAEIIEKITSTIEEDGDSDIFHRIVRAEIYREIIKAINNLPDRCGTIFKLAYIEHLDNNQISEKLSISINTVKVQKNNAKKQLRKHLKHIYPIAVLLFHL